MLIAYLASLKAPQSTAAALHGMPPEIPCSEDAGRA